MAGEVSGDMHAAKLIREVNALDARVEWWGIGGDEMAGEGVELLSHVRDMAVLGISEVLMRYRFFKRVFNELVQATQERKPDLILLVDYPGFNLRFAEKIRSLNIRCVYYISPQVWAWKSSRIPKMARVLDRLMVIFPFEASCFKDTKLQVDYVGHPLTEETSNALAQPAVDLPWSDGWRVAVLPGSREQEIRRILPVLIETAVCCERVAEEPVSFLVAVASQEARVWCEEVMAGCSEKPKSIQLVEGQTRQILKQAMAGLVASGTATLEAALMQCPMVVVYKTAFLTYFIGSRVVKLPYIGMVNIVAGKEICPEFIQGEAVPDDIAKALQPLLTDTATRQNMMQGLDQVRRELEPAGQKSSAGEIVFKELKNLRKKQY